MIVLDAGYEYDDDGNSFARRLSERDVKQFEAALRAAGAEIANHWNGAGHEHGSWLLKGKTTTPTATTGRSAGRRSAGRPSRRSPTTGRPLRDGSWDIEEGDGYGVCLPAETALLLTRLAVEASNMGLAARDLG